MKIRHFVLILLLFCAITSIAVGRKVPDGVTADNAWDGAGSPPADIGWTADSNLPQIGNELSYSRTVYDIAGRVEQTITLDQDGYEQPTSYEYDDAGRQTAVIDPNGHRTETEYEGTRRKLVRDALNNETSFIYDALGRNLTTILPETAQNPVTYIHTEFDSLGRRIAQSDQIDEADYSIVDPCELRIFGYDAAGRLTSVLLPEVYDPCTESMADPCYVYAYDIYGNQTLIRDALGRETGFTYDWLGNQTSRTLPDGRCEYKQYDALGRIVKATDFAGQIIGCEYNGRGQLQFKKFYADETAYGNNDPCETIEYTYDGLGRRNQIIESRGTTTYTYDAEGRVTDANSPEGTIYYEYNSITGSKTKAHTADTATEYGYDALGRLAAVEVVKRNGQTPDPAEIITYGYNEVGSRSTVEYANGNFAEYAYDALNRLTNLANYQDNTKATTLSGFDYTIKDDGMRSGVDESLSEEHTITYSYDNLNRITEEAATATGGDYSTSYTYDLVGNRLKRIVEVTNTTVGSQTLTTNYYYDPNTDALVKEVHDGPVWAAAVGERPVYAYVSGGSKITYKAASGGVGKFTAFALGLPNEWSLYVFVFILMLVPVMFFGPAIVVYLRRFLRPPPRRQNPYLSVWQRCLCILLAYMMLLTPAGLEQLAQAATQYSQLDSRQWAEGNRTIEYTYDDNGSVTSRITKVTTTQAELERVVYEYNLQNRLSLIKVSTDGGQSWDSITEYKYDTAGNRVAKTVDGVTTNYLIDSFNHTGYAQVFIEEDATDTTSYVIGDDVLAQATNTSSPEYLLYDGHGSTRQLTSSSGVVVDSYSYDAYGVMLGGNPTPSSPADTSLLYTGEQFDNDLGQYYLRARYYNPLNGTFNRTDPYAGNLQDPPSLHKYLYCHANPVNNTDPTGRGITDLVSAITIRMMLFGMEYGPKIAAGIWAVTKITAVAWMASLTTLILQDLGVIPQNEYVAEIAAILGIVLIAELFIIAMLPARWTNPPARRGVNHPTVRKAVEVGNRVHYDKTTDPTRYRHAGGPTQLKHRYPNTVFRFAKRGQKMVDVRYIGGDHPSTYRNSSWPSGINKVDFKPDTPTGNAMKIPPDTMRILYNPQTGQIKH